MEMHQVRYFLAVCETLNFTKAAKNCDVAQPSLSRAIGKLEQELGGQLFRRERNLFQLTNLGRLVRPHLETVYSASESAHIEANSFRQMETAQLSLGIMCTIGPGQLTGLLASMQAQVPGLELSLHEAPLEGLIERLSQGDLDVALLATPSALPERFDFRPLYKERYVVAFSPGHRFEGQNDVRIHDMDQEPYLARLNCEYSDHVGDLLAERGVTLNTRYRSEREDWIQSMVLAGMGCTLLPEYITLYPQLPTRLVTDPEVTREVGLATVAGRQFSPAVKAFVHMARTREWIEAEAVARAATG